MVPDSSEVATNTTFLVLDIHPDHKSYSCQHSFEDDEVADDDSLFNCNDNDDDGALDSSIFVVDDCSKSLDNHRRHHLIRDDDCDVDDDDCYCDMIDYFDSSVTIAGIPNYVTGTVVVSVQNAVATNTIDYQSFVVIVNELAVHYVKCCQEVFVMVEDRQMAWHLV
jgi:hypothetical protein